MTGLVLAGGGSARMGRDKAVLRLGGRTLVDRAVAVLADCCDPVLIASGDGRRLTGPGVEQVADRPPGAGPLAGILAGLERSPHPLVAVVAVDMPYASAGVLELLAAQWRGEPAVVPAVAGRLEPLHAVWHRDAAPLLRRRLAAGRRSATAAAVALGARVVDASVWAAVDPAAAFARNVNLPEDLRGLGAD